MPKIPLYAKSINQVKKHAYHPYQRPVFLKNSTLELKSPNITEYDFYHEQNRMGFPIQNAEQELTKKINTVVQSLAIFQDSSRTERVIDLAINLYKKQESDTKSILTDSSAQDRHITSLMHREAKSRNSLVFILNASDSNIMNVSEQAKEKIVNALNDDTRTS